MSVPSTDLSKSSFTSLAGLFIFQAWLSRTCQVYSKIRLLAILACSIAVLTSPVLHAQDQPEPDTKLEGPSGLAKAETAAVQEAVPEQQVESAKVPTVGPNQQTTLRLEATIRGNKEQPQVLTIVPWQLPIHQRINENSEWQLQATQLTSIERNAFLRNLAVVNELKRAQAKPVLRNETVSDDN